MPRPEKTVFISYRRKDISWALAVYHYLTKHDYDVFFDYKSIPSGDFEQIIVGNIKARAHFLVILTPTALDRANEPGDWLRREIENAISERRNIIPLFFDGFNFGAPSVSEKLTGKLSRLKRYNGLEVPAGYFDEAMERLRSRYLNVTLDAVMHPVSEEVQKKVKEHQVAANQAISNKAKIEEKARKEKEVEERTRLTAELKTKKEQEEKERKLAEEKARKDAKRQARRAAFERIQKWVVETLTGIFPGGKGFFQKINPKQYSIGGVLILALLILFYGGNYIVQNLPASNAPDVTNTPTTTIIVSPTVKLTNTVTITPTSTATATFTVSPSPTSAFNVGDIMISEKDGMTMVFVPAGEFEMGSEDGEDNEKPVHTVYLDAFWIDQTEVTNAMYARCVDAGECATPDYSGSYTRDSYYGIAEFDDYPVIAVSWNDASAYCSWAGRRLPTEAEWEKAARGEGAYIYPWGSDPPNNNLLNYGENIGDTTKVGSYPDGASLYGALDMAGNAWEWVNDWYDDNYYQNSPPTNPHGPLTGQIQVTRGGAWYNSENYVRSAFRYGYTGKVGYDVNGVRCVMDDSE
jgi:formylglycine-generating enzyme required for sulfatase activity